MEKAYDAIFVGGSLTALAAAASLARKRKSVLVLNAAELESALPAASPFHFSQGPLLFSGFEERGAAEGFFSELGLPIPALKKRGLLFKKEAPVLQLVLPHHRVDLYSQQEEYTDELKREFGDQLQQIKSFFQEVEKQEAIFYPYLGQFPQTEIQGLADRFHLWRERLRFLLAVKSAQSKSALSFTAPFGFSSDFVQYLNLQLLFAYKKDLSASSSFELIRLIASLQKGVRMINGYSTLLQFLLKQIKEDGGEILESKKVAKVEMKGKKISRVILDDGTPFSCGSLVITEADPSSFLHFYFRLRREWIPSPMKESLLMTWGASVPSEVENILILRLSLPEEEAPFPPDARGLGVTLLLRPGVAVTDSGIASLKARTLERLHWLMPFSKSEIHDVEKDLQAPPSNPFLPTLVKSWKEDGKETRKGSLKFFRPREARNVFVIQSDLSKQLLWGSDFLAAGALARLLEEEP